MPKETSVGGPVTAIDEWVALFASRDEMATAYADLLRTKNADWKTWPTLNLAIMDRWSSSGLQYIKRQAWKAVEAL